MSLEQAIIDLTAAVKANTAAHSFPSIASLGGESNPPALVDTGAPAAAAAPKKTRGKAAATAAPPASAPAGVETVQVGATEGPPVVADAPKVNAKTVADEFIALASAKGRATAVAILAKFGVQRASELKADQLAPFLEAVRAAAGPKTEAAPPAADSLI